MGDSQRYEQALERIDEANAEDPNTEVWDGDSYKKEVLYAQRMTEWVNRLCPEASDALKVAARAQHIRRWEIPRSDYPMTRAGYHRWRTTLYKYHADKVGEILTEVGYDAPLIECVRNLVSKKNLKTDPETQTLEDAAALVFLQYHLEDFVERDDLDEAKLTTILKKTWAKMSASGHEAALGLDMPTNLRELVEKALG